MTLKKAAVAATMATAISLIGLAGVATWTPPVHAMHAAGAAAVQAYFAPGSVPRHGGPIPPSTSLDQVRCEVWKSTSSQPCPDGADLARRYWPTQRQSPNTLYLTLGTPSVASNDPSGFNVEHDRAHEVLVYNTYQSHALFVRWRADDTPGAGLQPGLELLVVTLSGIPSGTVQIIERDWTQRVTGDQRDGDYVLGTVTIA